MSFIRFATLCDRCGSRSDEYTAWPECRDCGEHVCPRCSTNPGTRTVTLGGDGFAELDAEVAVADCLQCAQHSNEAIADALIHRLQIEALSRAEVIEIVRDYFRSATIEGGATPPSEARRSNS